MTRWGAWVALMWLAVWGTGVVLAAEGPVDLGEVLAAGWKEVVDSSRKAITTHAVKQVISTAKAREERVKSLRCTWTSTELMVKDSMPAVGVDAETGARVIKRWPAEDTHLREDWTLYLDGAKVRFEKSGQTLNVSTGEFVPQRYVETLADGVVRAYSPIENAGVVGAFPFGETNVVGFLSAYRLFTTELAQLKPDEVRLVGREKHEGHPCLVIDAPLHIATQPKYRSMFRWWLAEDQEYCVVGYVHLEGPQPGYPKSDLWYEKDEQVGWRLVRWTLGISAQGWQMVNEVAQTEFNVPIGGDLFACFPAGARVGDHIRGTSYVVGEPAKTPAEDAAGSVEKTPLGQDATARAADAR